MVTQSKIEIFTCRVEKTTNFYEELGFYRIISKKDKYKTLRRDEFLLSISPIPWYLPLFLFRLFKLPPFGIEIVLYFQDIKLIRTRLLNSGYKPGKIKLQKWGVEDFRIIDPAGHYVRISNIDEKNL